MDELAELLEDARIWEVTPQTRKAFYLLLDKIDEMQDEIDYLRFLLTKEK